ncbi:ATP-binding protein [Enterobacter cloacae]|uniref:ATP-binding protein n=3 Tax=Enterobacter cloacae TaxID=550 RepID=UPI00255033B9|nr:ATP-binding protein [Enterobacter cloacae]MDV5633683.1 ATP-binding protein [Enterobacter cloacae]MDV5671654.1 ATP-binding protein [Enterobacter cloacae]
MSKREFVGTTNITHAGIKKLFTRWKDEPSQAVVELVANGFDAGASKVDVQIKRNDLGGLESVSVLDNGSGINIDKCEEHFSRFNESLKQGNDDLQGAHGKGRLSFHLFSQEAIWFTRYQGHDFKITINSESLRDFKVVELLESEQHASLRNLQNGTCVVLRHFTKNLPSKDSIIKKLQNSFGWRLSLNKNRKLFLNDVEINVPLNVSVEKNIEFDNFTFNVLFIRWISKPGVEKSYNYLVNKQGRIVFRELSSFNHKPNFYLSTYTRSDWGELFDIHDSSLNFSEEKKVSISSDEYRKLKSEIQKIGKEIYDNFLKEFVDEKIFEYEEKGYFPSYSNLLEVDAQWRMQTIKNTISSIYYADPSIFSNLKSKQAKILIHLIDKLIVSNENSELFDVLESILELDHKSLCELQSQIEKTSLQNIVSTIEVLQRRESAVQKLKEVVVSHYDKVRETPDLQLVIENNTWLFGNKYTMLGAEEDDFQRIAYNLRNHVKGIDTLTSDDFDQNDLADGLDIEGVRRQVDLFLARRRVEFNGRGESYFQCTIIEIKKPSVSLNEKHLKQLKDYAKIILQHPGFSIENMRFELILVGRKISSSDFEIGAALETAEARNEPGLVFDVKNGRIKGYVKTWGTIFSEFELSNNYLLNKLKLRREYLDGFDAEELIKDLHEPTE